MTRETKKKTAVNKKVAESKKTNSIVDEFTESFIKEVDEDVKNDNLKVFWNKYGIYVILLVVISLTLAVSFENIRAWKIKQNQAVTENYLSTTQKIQANQLDDSLLMFKKMAEEGKGIYRDLASLQEVNILLEQNKSEEAFALLNKFIDNTKANETLRNASRIKLVSLRFDDLPIEEMEKMLSPIQQDKNWGPYAKELLAMAKIRDHDLESAKNIYAEILDLPDLSDDFRNRIKDMISVLDIK